MFRGSCNYDMNSLSEVVISSLWSQGVADLVIVVVKLRADEDMVTYLRVKLAARSKKAKGKGPDMLTKCKLDAWTTVIVRLENKT